MDSENDLPGNLFSQCLKCSERNKTWSIVSFIIYIFDKTYLLTYIRSVMLKRIAGGIPDFQRQRTIRRAALGLGYFAVEVEEHQVGLSANLGHLNAGSCNVFSQAGQIAGSSVAEILEFSKKTGFLQRSLALATMNALIKPEIDSLDDDVFSKVSPAAGERVVMIGLIEPVAKMLSDTGCDVAVFEQRSIEHPLVRESHEMKILIRDADLLIISATTLINNTLGDILALPRAARDIILMGPSTPMMVDAFRSTGITYLAGSRIVDTEKAMTIVMEGGGTQALYHGGAMKKVVREIV